MTEVKEENKFLKNSSDANDRLEITVDVYFFNPFFLSFFFFFSFHVIKFEISIHLNEWGKSGKISNENTNDK